MPDPFFQFPIGFGQVFGHDVEGVTKAAELIFRNVPAAVGEIAMSGAADGASTGTVTATMETIDCTTRVAASGMMISLDFMTFYAGSGPCTPVLMCAVRDAQVLLIFRSRAWLYAGIS